MENNKYNGWTNWETWNLNLWFDDVWTDQAEEAFSSAEACDTFSKAENATHTLAELIECDVRAIIDDETGNLTGGFASDAISMAIQAVNFHEIADHYISAVEE